jgi:FkbM family methyltransferase
MANVRFTGTVHGGLDPSALSKHIGGDAGFFVEVGANDGLTLSPTLVLEREHGWHGLLIEPIPELAQRCRENRPTALVEEAALVAPDYALPTIRMVYAGLNSVVHGARGSREDDLSYAQAGARMQGNVYPYEVEVPAKTLSAIFDSHSVSEVDLLCLDLEGYELNGLRGLQLDRHRPRFILVEVWRHSEAAIDSYLASHYERVGELGALNAEGAHEFGHRDVQEGSWREILYVARG